MEKKSHERLDRYINERRLDLDPPLKLQQVANLAGISVPTLTALRKGTNVPTEDTKRGVERALRWAAGSIDRILAGGEPREAPAGFVYDRPMRSDDAAAKDWSEEDEEDPFDRMDRLYEEWKRDPEKGQALRTILESWGDRKTG